MPRALAAISKPRQTEATDFAISIASVRLQMILMGRNAAVGGHSPMSEQPLWILARCIEFEGKVYAPAKQDTSYACDPCEFNKIIGSVEHKNVEFCKRYCITYPTRGNWGEVITNEELQGQPSLDLGPER